MQCCLNHFRQKNWKRHYINVDQYTLTLRQSPLRASQQNSRLESLMRLQQQIQTLNLANNFLLNGVSFLETLCALKTLTEMMVSGIARDIVAVDDEVMKAGQSVITEEHAEMSNGPGYYLSHKVPLKDSRGEVIGMLGISFDITEQKKMQEKLQRTHEEKVETMKALAGTIAHELKTPLATIHSISQGIQNYFPQIINGYQLAKEAELPVENIRPSVFKTLVSIPDAIKDVINSTNTVINMILMNIREEIHHKDKFKKCNIVDSINDALNAYCFADGMRQCIAWDQTQADFSYFGDNLLTKHILFNLLNNSLFYLANSPDPKITIEFKKTDHNNLVIFRDNGPGIPKEILPNIFERFFSHRKTGTGIGLAFCKLVMESYGGEIVCDSEVGKYTAFILKFPLL